METAADAVLTSLIDKEPNSSPDVKHTPTVNDRVLAFQQFLMDRFGTGLGVPPPSLYQALNSPLPVRQAGR